MKNSSYKLFFDKFFTDTAVVPSLWEMRNKFVSENFCPKRRHCMSRTWRQTPPTPPSSPRLQSPPSHQFSGRPGETQLYQEAPSKWRKYAKSNLLQLFRLRGGDFTRGKFCLQGLNVSQFLSKQWEGLFKWIHFYNKASNVIQISSGDISAQLLHHLRFLSFLEGSVAVGCWAGARAGVPIGSWLSNVNKLFSHSFFCLKHFPQNCMNAHFTWQAGEEREERSSWAERAAMLLLDVLLGFERPPPPPFFFFLLFEVAGGGAGLVFRPYQFTIGNLVSL